MDSSGDDAEDDDDDDDADEDFGDGTGDASDDDDGDEEKDDAQRKRRRVSTRSKSSTAAAAEAEARRTARVALVNAAVLRAKAALVTEWNAFIADARAGITDHGRPMLDALKAWRAISNTYPMLAIVARMIFAASATEFACERLFSRLRAIVREQRCRLDPQNVDYLIQIVANGELLGLVE